MFWTGLLGEAFVALLSLSRVALLCLLTVALNGTWVIEQPRSSLLMLHDRMSQLLSHFKVGLPKLDQFILILHDAKVLYGNLQALGLPINLTHGGTISVYVPKFLRRGWYQFEAVCSSTLNPPDPARYSNAVFG